jgi:hypothetical protein
VAPRSEGPQECLATNHSAECFVRLTDETEAAVLGALAGRTLADSLDELRAIDPAGAARASRTPGFSQRRPLSRIAGPSARAWTDPSEKHSCRDEQVPGHAWVGTSFAGDACLCTQRRGRTSTECHSGGEAAGG